MTLRVYHHILLVTKDRDGRMCGHSSSSPKRTSNLEDVGNRRNYVKATQACKLAVGAMLVAASLHAYAEDASAPVGATSGATATAAQQNKAAKAANRALSRKVRAALAKDKNISVANVSVRAKGGAVTLQGAVPDQSQVDRATEVAKGVAGVTSVQNALTIRSPGG
jgi:hyperosmotically inducible periplasmic protein